MLLKKDITAFSHKVAESQTKTTHHENIVQLIASTKYSNRNIILVCTLKVKHSASLSVSEKRGSEMKQLTVAIAIGMAKKQSCYLSLAKKSISYGGL